VLVGLCHHTSLSVLLVDILSFALVCAVTGERGGRGLLMERVQKARKLALDFLFLFFEKRGDRRGKLGRADTHRMRKVSKKRSK